MIKIIHTDYEVILQDTNDEVYSNQIIFRSQYLIKKIVYYKQLDRIAILFHSTYYKKDSQNVICIDTKGILQWILPPLEDEMKGNRMIDIDISRKKYIVVYSFDGVHRLIDVATGKVIQHIYGK